MINFQKLQLEVNEKYSFVGIKRRDSKIIFCLPKGFDPSLFTTYDKKRDLFFLLYRVLRNFKEICLQKGYLQFDAGIKTPDRDGVIRNGGSVQKITLPDLEIEENIFYSKLDMIDSILKAYDEPKILSLVYRLGKSEKIDYSKLHLFLHHAVYLNNGAAYIDAMTLPRQMVHYQPTDIVGMYCYILVEVKQQLQDEVSGEVAALAEQFKHRHIGAAYGLFHEKHSSQTFENLKDVLELIDRNTAIKDVDYWDFYDSIELFLYGDLSQFDEGEIWGIKNFHSVWESMCLTYLAKKVAPEYILHLDTKFLSDDVVAFINSYAKVLDLANVFRIQGNQLVPDAVVLSTGFNRFRNKKQNTFASTTELKPSSWNDFGYQITFSNVEELSLKYEKFRIAYRDQPRDIHTSLKLKKLYKIQNNKLIIDSQLPSDFYSFWKIDIDNLNDKVLDMMFQLNHIFYIAMNKNIYTSDKFRKFLEDELNTDIFKTSLLRDIDDNSLINMFINFLQKVRFFNIIDIKYLPLEYFLNVNNRRQLKEKSIRKQFVYEYVLQQFMENNENFKIWEIKSSFWLPFWESSSSIVEKVEPDYLNGYIDLRNINFAVYLDGYIDLRNINFAVIADSYID